MVQEFWEGAPFFSTTVKKRGRVPHEQCWALQAESASRAGKQMAGTAVTRAHDKPHEVIATLAAPPPPTKKAPKPTATASASAACVSASVVDVKGMEAADGSGACEAFGDLDVPATVEIVSAVVAALGNSKLKMSKEVT